MFYVSTLTLKVLLKFIENQIQLRAFFRLRFFGLSDCVISSVVRHQNNCDRRSHSGQTPRQQQELFCAVMWSACFTIFQCVQATLADRQHTSSIESCQWTTLSVWHYRHLDCLGAFNVLAGLWLRSMHLSLKCFWGFLVIVYSF